MPRFFVLLLPIRQYAVSRSALFCYLDPMRLGCDLQHLFRAHWRLTPGSNTVDCALHVLEAVDYELEAA